MRHELNAQIADRLRLMAEVREQQGDDGFRVEAYRRAASAIDALERPVDAILAEEGRAGLVALPHVGAGIAALGYSLLGAVGSRCSGCGHCGDTSSVGQCR